MKENGTISSLEKGITGLRQDHHPPTQEKGMWASCATFFFFFSLSLSSLFFLAKSIIMLYCQSSIKRGYHTFHTRNAIPPSLHNSYKIAYRSHHHSVLRMPKPTER